MKRVLVLAVFLFISVMNLFAGTFNQGNLVVVRLGNGIGALSSAAANVFLDEYTTSGIFVQSISMPTAINSSNRRFVISGNSTSEGFLSLSPNGQYLTLGGYDTIPGFAGVVAAAGVNRVVALVDYAGNINTTSYFIDGYVTSNIRSAVTSDGSAFWTGGTASSTGGIRYILLGGTTSTSISTTVQNTRVINIFNNQLYISSASGTFTGINKVGTGTPTTTGQTTFRIFGGTSGTGTPSPYAYIFNSDTTICYVADDRTTANGGGIQKWTSSLGSWSLSYILKTGLPSGLRGLSVDFSGSNPVIYATIDAAIYTTTDVGALSSFTSIASASANTVFRGIAFAPSPYVSLTRGTFIGQVVPKYMATGDTTRIPVVFRAQVQGLLPNTTYRYNVQAALINELGGASGGAGNPIYISPDGTTYTVPTPSPNFIPNLKNAGNFGTFTTDGAGTYTGYFAFANNGNYRFTAGNYVIPTITIDSAGNGIPKFRLALYDSIYVLTFSTSSGAGNGTGIYGLSNASQKNIVALFDNPSGTDGIMGGSVHPLAMTYVESEGTSLTGVPRYYSDSVNGFSGRWGTIIPNTNSNGVQRIEQFSVSTGTSVNFNTDNDGIWPIGGSTVNPTGGSGGPIRIDITDAPLPVQLSSFASIVNKNSVKLIWQTAFEINNKGFQIERQNSNNNVTNTWQQVSFINGKGTTNQAQSYFYEDKNLGIGTYKYRLKQIDYNGNTEYFSLANQVIIGKPADYSISQNFPNPFNPSTSILYSLPDDAFIQLRIYDVTGRLVSELINGNTEKGYHSVEFNGTNLASGIYFYQLMAKGAGDKILYSKIMKMLLVK